MVAKVGTGSPAFLFKETGADALRKPLPEVLTMDAGGTARLFPSPSHPDTPQKEGLRLWRDMDILGAAKTLVSPDGIEPSTL
jgi:hypothetical protein